MTGYYQRPQVTTSYRVTRGVLVAGLVALLLACLQSFTHLDTEEDLAQLTPEQRAAVVSRWGGE